MHLLLTDGVPDALPDAVLFPELRSTREIVRWVRSSAKLRAFGGGVKCFECTVARSHAYYYFE